MMLGKMFILAYSVSRPRSTMLFLKRLLILFSLVLFSAHGAFAHVAFAHSEWSSEHAAQMSGMVMETSILQKRVTYDFARLMEGATQVSCSGFGQVLIGNL